MEKYLKAIVLFVVRCNIPLLSILISKLFKSMIGQFPLGQVQVADRVDNNIRLQDSGDSSSGLWL